MSNLGVYQWITTASKKVGGPINLLVITAAGGYAVIRLAEAGGKIVYKKVKSRLDKKTIKCVPDADVFTIVKDGISNENVKFKKGDKFRVIQQDGDAILIDRIGDDNSPYFVSEKMLEEISDF